MFFLAPLAIESLMEQLQNNFSVAGPASLTLSSLIDDPVAVARHMYLHYTGTTHTTEAHAEGLNRVSVVPLALKNISGSYKSCFVIVVFIVNLVFFVLIVHSLCYSHL